MANKIKAKFYVCSADTEEEGIFYPSYLTEIFIGSWESLQVNC